MFITTCFLVASFENDVLLVRAQGTHLMSKSGYCEIKVPIEYTNTIYNIIIQRRYNIDKFIQEILLSGRDII